MDNKAAIESILKQRFFVTPTNYPPQNGFLDYGPPLAQIKLQILSEFRKVFADENTYELEPSAVLPYEVLKNSGHIDKFCDVILTDGESVYRADHYIEEKIGEILTIPKNLNDNYSVILEKVELLKKNIILEKNCKIIQKKNVEDTSKAMAAINISAEKSSEQFTQEDVNSILCGFETVTKHLADCNKIEIDFIVILHNLHSDNGNPFNPSKDFNLIFKVNDRQFLRPEIAQSQFTNFRRLYDLNNERLPFSSLAIGRSYRNEISARGGMLRTKEFEQAEIEYFSEDGKHDGFDDVRDVEVCLVSSSKTEACKMTLGDAFDSKTISSEAICYFIAKAQEFLVSIGFKIDSLRYRQHHANEMAHYADDCWDVEIITLSGWIECAGIADRTNYDLTAHSKEVNVNVKKLITPKTVYDVVIDKQKIGKTLRSKVKDLEKYVLELPQTYIVNHMNENRIIIDFEGTEYEFGLKARTVDCEFFIPRVVEPSFGISRILYALVEQSFNIRDERNVLSLKPKMCYLHCIITYLKYQKEYACVIACMKSEFKKRCIRYRVNDRSCSIGRKYSSCDELGIPYFVTFDFKTLEDEMVTIRERDTMTQVRVKASMVASLIEDLILEKTVWSVLIKTHGLVEK